MKKLTVITQNQTGDLADITGALADRGINVEDIEADGHGRRGVIALTVALEAYDDAFRVLRGNGFRVLSEDALVVRIEDRPGALAEIAARFKDASIGLRSMHIIRRDREAGVSLASLVADDRARARELVRDVLA